MRFCILLSLTYLPYLQVHFAQFVVLGTSLKWLNLNTIFTKG
jgi:hypothetical protein